MPDNWAFLMWKKMKVIVLSIPAPEAMEALGF